MPLEHEERAVHVLLSFTTFWRISGASVSWPSLNYESQRLLMRCVATLTYLGEVVSYQREEFFTHITSEWMSDSSRHHYRFFTLLGCEVGQWINCQFSASLEGSPLECSSLNACCAVQNEFPSQSRSFAVLIYLDSRYDNVKINDPEFVTQFLRRMTSWLKSTPSVTILISLTFAISLEISLLSYLGCPISMINLYVNRQMGSKKHDFFIWGLQRCA